VANDIETYLRELQAALASAGADPALMQDALFDAEEYLQAAMAVGGKAGRGTATYEARLTAAVQGYGTPEEVAGAYLGTPVSSAPLALAEAVHQAAAGAGAVTVPPPAYETALVTAPAEASAGVEPATAAEATMAGEATAVPASTVAAEPSISGAAPRVPPGVPEMPAAPYPPGQQYPPGQPYPPGTQYGPGPQYGQVPVGVATGMAAAAGTTAPAKPTSIWYDIFGVFADGWVWKSFVYMLLSLVTGTVYFTIVVTGISTAGGMIVLIIGIPLLVAVLGLVRAMAFFEGRVVEALLDTRMPRRPRSDPPGMGFFERILFWLKDGRTWASMVYMVLMLPLGTIYFTIAVTGIATGIGLITAPIWGWFGDHTFIFEGVTYDWWLPAWGIRSEERRVGKE